MPKSKKKLILKDIQLIDLPTRQNRMLVKIKNCVSPVTTKPYPIVDNQCIFTDPVEIDVNLPKNIASVASKPRLGKVKPLRLSFRLEDPSGIGFTRYGIAMVDLIKVAIDGTTSNPTYNGVVEIRMRLENCAEKPLLIMSIIFPHGFIIPNAIFHSGSISPEDSSVFLSASSLDTETSLDDTSFAMNSTSISSFNERSITTKTVSNSISQKNMVSTSQTIICRSKSMSNSQSSNQRNSSQSKASNGSSSKANNSVSINGGRPAGSLTVPSLSNSNSSYYPPSTLMKPITNDDNLSVKISKQRYDELEGKINDLLASIINEDEL